MAKKKRHGIRNAGLLLVLFLLVLLSLLFYTVENTKPKQLSLGVVSLDEGDTVYDSGNNLGSEMLTKLTSGEFAEAALNDGGQSSPGSYTIEFKRYETEEDVKNAVENDEVYGAVVIPSDYTNSMHPGTIRTTVEETVHNGANVVLDAAQNPAVSQAAEEAVSTVLDAAGLDAMIEPSTLSVDERASIPDPVFHMLLLVPPLAAGIVLAVLYKIRKGLSFGDRARRFGFSLLLNAGISLLLAILLYLILVVAIRFSEAPVPSILYMWVVDFLLMTFADGLANVNAGMALIVVAVFLMLGGVLGLLPLEAFPPIIQNLAFPWLTTTFTDWNLGTAVVDGMGPWVQGLSDIWIYALAGIIAALMAASFSNGDARREDS